MKQAVNTIVTHLNREPLEDRVAKARAVSDMAKTDGWLVFTDLLDAALEDAREQVEFGTHEYEVYAAMHGRIRGLRYAASIVEAVVESGDRASNELQQIAAREDAHE